MRLGLWSFFDHFLDFLDRSDDILSFLGREGFCTSVDGISNLICGGGDKIG